MKYCKIYNKDSRNLSGFIKKGSVDFIVFSPPYWNIRNYGFDGQIGHKQTYDEYLDDMEKVFTECFKVLKNNRFMAINTGTAVSNDGMKFLSGDFINRCQKIGFTLRKDIIWHKPRGTTKWQRGATQFSQSPYPLMYNTNINHEYILIFQKGDKKESFKNEPKFSRNFIRRMAYSVWEIKPVNSPKIDEKHVAPFPEELPKRLIQLYTFKGDVVLDPFAGSGTTNKMAKQLGRNSIAVELSKDYCSLIEKKLMSVEFNSDIEDVYKEVSEEEIIRNKLIKAKADYEKIQRDYNKIVKNKGQYKIL